MRSLLKILGGGFAVFLVLAVAQEWEVFAEPVFGGSAETPEPTAPDGAAAEAALRRYFSLMRHVYASGGDPRFVERLPASDRVRREVLADVAYLDRNRRRQDPELVDLTVTRADPLGEGRLEVRTKEYWVVRTHLLGGSRPADPPRSRVAFARYLLVPAGDGLRVDGWDALEPEPEASAP